MNANLRKLVLLLAAGIILGSCKRQLTRDEVEHQLQGAMYKALTSRPGFDSTKYPIEIKSVIFYELPESYDCQFVVRMRLSSGHDTTGVMTAYITKDFTKVRRKS